jgi:hypothetical protein
MTHQAFLVRRHLLRPGSVEAKGDAHPPPSPGPKQVWARNPHPSLLQPSDKHGPTEATDSSSPPTWMSTASRRSTTPKVITPET